MNPVESNLILKHIQRSIQRSKQENFRMGLEQYPCCWLVSEDFHDMLGQRLLQPRMEVTLRLLND